MREHHPTERAIARTEYRNYVPAALVLFFFIGHDTLVCQTPCSAIVEKDIAPYGNRLEDMGSYEKTEREGGTSRSAGRIRAGGHDSRSGQAYL